MDTRISSLGVRSRARDGTAAYSRTRILRSDTDYHSIQYENKSLTIMRDAYKMPFRLPPPPTARTPSRDAGPGRNIAPAAAASCVGRKQGQPVRELDLGAISMRHAMRHAMRDDGIGSRQEQRSHTQLSHTLKGSLEGGGVPVTARSSAPVWGCPN